MPLIDVYCPVTEALLGPLDRVSGARLVCIPMGEQLKERAASKIQSEPDSGVNNRMRNA